MSGQAFFIGVALMAVLLWLDRRIIINGGTYAGYALWGLMLFVLTTIVFRL